MINNYYSMLLIKKITSYFTEMIVNVAYILAKLTVDKSEDNNLLTVEIRFNFLN